MDLGAHVKSVIELTACKYHNQNPLLEFIDDQVVVIACCPDFKVICLKKLIRILIEHRDQTLRVAWRSPRVSSQGGLHA
ncbi:MAG TPA: hypothetical protein VK671_01265 [Mucilaginibacter sp.]|jgi:hypothetical protein|nr:hypothetical protein [Mucilaginibacter sp.]